MLKTTDGKERGMKIDMKKKKTKGGKFILTIVFLFNYAPYAPMNDDDKM